MNCKQGDLVVIVKCGPYPHLQGKFCTTVSKAPHPYDWVLDFQDNGKDMYAMDWALKPIRDNDKEDETLSWKAVPKPVVTKLPAMIK